MDLSWNSVFDRAIRLGVRMLDSMDDGCDDGSLSVCPVPRGGVFAALVLKSQHPNIDIADHPDGCDVVLDDIIDSGETRNYYIKTYGKPFFALVDKITEGIGEWVTFPWERMMNEQGAESNIVRLLEFIGEDPNREGLKETPGRVLRAYGELFSGYGENVDSILKLFEDGACDEMVLLKNVEFTSFCEHHMLPFNGLAHVAYLPNGRVIGVSKLARIVEVFSKRLQIQERLTQQITEALDKYLSPLGSACVVEARHECMACRGVKKQNAVMVTSSLTGRFRDSAVRQEFFSLVKN